MKIARAIQGGETFWGVVDPDNDRFTTICGSFGDWAPPLTSNPSGYALELGQARILSEMRLLPPIERTSKIVVAGANYARHLKEFNLAEPARPFAFLKAYNALIGAHDPIQYPARTAELDFEVELVAIIGSERLDRNDPLSSVLGYTVGNDVSARDLQRAGPVGVGMDLYAAKSQFGTTGLGPWIVTRDEFPATTPVLRMELKVNGEVRQDASTSEMTWGVGELLAFLDVNTPFELGDVMFTGTPHGNALADGRFLQPGDRVEATIEKLGTLSNVVAERAGEPGQ
jgi:2-keto-4-pentenoate hydratase/2-oxohepta-3-ene-1,7-dioic acid hydratase in catechol pathway